MKWRPNEAPNTKLQPPEKPQAPNPNVARSGGRDQPGPCQSFRLPPGITRVQPGACNLVLLWRLELGVWCLARAFDHRQQKGVPMSAVLEIVNHPVAGRVGW